MTERPPIGPILLRLPADPSLSRVVRLAAAGLGSLAGCTIDEIEDVQLAVSEVLLALVEHGDGAPIELDLLVTARAFEVCGRADVVDFVADHPDMVLCRAVLDGVCDEVDIRSGDGSVTIRALVTRLAP